MNLTRPWLTKFSMCSNFWVLFRSAPDDEPSMDPSMAQESCCFCACGQGDVEIAVRAIVACVGVRCAARIFTSKGLHWRSAALRKASSPELW